jgi:hypothetical protein
MSKIIEVAISQLGVTEDNLHTNGGEAKKYQDAVGLPHDGKFPWCQSFVYWCGLQAYGDANPIPKTGGVLDCWNKAVMAEQPHIIDRYATPDNIIVGSQLIMDFGGGLGHTCLIERVDPDGTLHTIEGNGNENGGRDGYEVCRRTRHIHDKLIKGFINYNYPESIA